MTDITHPPVKEALHHLENLYSDEELRLAAERREQALIDAEDTLDYARHEGERKGLQKGFALILEAQLQSKLDSLPDWVGLRIKSANETTLNRWAIRVLNAQSVEDVFGD